MGPTISDPVPLRPKTPHQEGGVLVGQVIRVDHFGNLITNVHRKDLEQLSGKAPPVIKVGNSTIKGVHETYSEVGKGEILALIGSSGFLEIAVHLGRACDRLRLDSEDIVGAELEVSRSC
jgi:S-adenosylmethionine hydrolase